jgi:hypothetical protein
MIVENDTCACESSPTGEYSGNLQVTVVRSVAGLEQIRDAWTAWNCHPNSDVDFYLLLMEGKTEIIRPHIIVVSWDGRPVAMLIGRIVEQRVDLKIGYKTILKPRVRMLSIVHGGTLGDMCAENCDLLIRELMQSLYRGEADVAALNSIKAGSPLYLSATRLPTLFCREFSPSVRAHWQLCLADNGEYSDNRSSKHHRELRREGKKLRAEIRCFRESSELVEMIATIEGIAAKTYQRGLGVGFMDNDETRSMLHLEAAKGWLRAYVLYAADQPCAFWTGSVYRGVFHSGPLGFDPIYRKYSPGNFLIAMAIKKLSNDGVREIDFGLGDAAYKQLLCNRRWDDAVVYLFAPTFKGLCVNTLRTSTTILDRVARECLGVVGLLPKIKRLWRDRARKQ